jgi:hypothetical protein
MKDCVLLNERLWNPNICDSLQNKNKGIKCHILDFIYHAVEVRQIFCHKFAFTILLTSLTIGLKCHRLDFI